MPCSSTGNTQCLECTRECLVSAGSSNGIMGSCSSGTDLQDAVQCISSSSPVGLPCAANEWLSASLSEYAISTEAVGSPLDDGTPSDSMDFFKSDFVMEESGVVKAVYLGSVKASDSKRSIVKIVQGTTLIGFALPRDVYYSRLDSRGIDKTPNGPYPTASFSYWDALDVMFSWDASSIYIFFSWTYDFIAKCNVQPGAIGSASCSYLSTVQFNVLLQLRWMHQNNSISEIFDLCIFCCQLLRCSLPCERDRWLQEGTSGLRIPWPEESTVATSV